MHEARFSEVIFNVIAIPLIIFIGLYLLGCSIAPLVDLNNQTFKIIFTLTGGFPSLLYYFNKSD